MESKENIDRLVQETLDSVSGIDSVKTPPFFKDKVLQRMAQPALESEGGLGYIDWFTPKYQTAALIAFVVLNMVALLSPTTDSYGDEVADFAEVYGLSETDTESYFYENEIR